MCIIATPRINTRGTHQSSTKDTRSRRLCASIPGEPTNALPKIRGVGDSAHEFQGNPPTSTKYTLSRRLCAFQYRGNPLTSTKYMLSRRLCASISGEPTNFYQLYAESVTLRINTRRTHQLSSMINGVGDAAHQYQGNPPTLYKDTQSRRLFASLRPWGVCTDGILSRKPGFLLSAMHSHAFRWFSAAPLVFLFLALLPLQLYQIWRIFCVMYGEECGWTLFVWLQKLYLTEMFEWLLSYIQL
jgi:hypothetical protein